MRRVVVASALLFAFATSAEARTHHHHYQHYSYHHHRHFARAYGSSDAGSGFGFASSNYSSFDNSGFGNSGFGSSGFGSEGFGRSRRSRRVAYSGGGGGRVHGGRPAAWCGWYMRSQVGSDPGPQYNLARSWAHYGSNAGGPSVGTIVVWSHHVGKIVGRENGQWIVESGNDGHAVRARPRSLAGAIAFRNAYASF